MRPAEAEQKRKKIVQLGAEQNHRCCYCGVAILYDAADRHTNKATIDHVQPLGRGGRRIWENEVAACWLCNNSRGSMPALAYFELVQREGRVRPQRRTQAERENVRRVAPAPLPAPPMSMKLWEYFALVYGVDKAEEIAAMSRNR